MMPIQECLICGISIWPLITERDARNTASGSALCFVHQRARTALSLDDRWVLFKRAVKEASDKKSTDWCVGQSHQERQCAQSHTPLPWQPKFDDILRRAMFWLLEDGSEAA
jgi:hypothetical protein